MILHTNTINLIRYNNIPVSNLFWGNTAIYNQIPPISIIPLSKVSGLYMSDGIIHADTKSNKNLINTALNLHNYLIRYPSNKVVWSNKSQNIVSENTPLLAYCPIKLSSPTSFSVLKYCWFNQDAELSDWTPIVFPSTTPYKSSLYPRKTLSIFDGTSLLTTLSSWLLPTNNNTYMGWVSYLVEPDKENIKIYIDNDILIFDSKNKLFRDTVDNVNISMEAYFSTGETDDFEANKITDPATIIALCNNSIKLLIIVKLTRPFP